MRPEYGTVSINGLNRPNKSKPHFSVYGYSTGSGVAKRQAVKAGVGGNRWSNRVVPYDMAYGTFCEYIAWSNRVVPYDIAYGTFCEYNYSLVQPPCALRRGLRNIL